MTRRFLGWLTSRLQAPRVIQDGLGRDRYLSRWYLFGRGRPTMPDGSSPFDRWGNPVPGAVWPDVPWAVYLHRFHRGDVDRELHNHPWRWAVSLILAGGYREERRAGGEVAVRLRLPGDLNFIDADDFHRVDLLEEDAWSLFVVGPKFQGWGFWDRFTGVVTPWREFLATKQSGGAK